MLVQSLLLLLAYAFILHPWLAMTLIHRLSTNAIQQVWYTDDATASGELSKIGSWWEHLVEIGP